jgi:hypothetical protein
MLYGVRMTLVVITLLLAVTISLRTVDHQKQCRLESVAYPNLTS